MNVAEINRELDVARDSGPLRDIIIPHVRSYWSSCSARSTKVILIRM